MPRSASKAKPNKPKPRSTVKESTPTGPEQDIEHIIPGRSSRPQWNNMIQEDTDEIVGEVMDELLGNAMDRCYKVYIQRQLVPYSASWAGKYLTQTVEQQFFCLDEGDEPEELCRTEDSEPMPATPDSRAQGCVPVVQASNQPHCTSHISFSQDNDQVPVQTGPSVKEEFNAFALIKSPVKQAETETRPKMLVSDPPCIVPRPRPPAKTNRKEQGNKQPPKKVPVNTPPSLSSSVKKNNTEVKSNIEDTAFKEKATSVYDLKTRQPIPKLDPSRLPQRYIFPEYEIVDHPKPIPRRPGGRPRLEPKTAKSVKPPISSKDQPKMFQKRNENDVRLAKYEQERVSPGSQRLDVKVLAKSVSLLESQAVKSSPVKSAYPSESDEMMPIQSHVAAPMFSVDQVTAGPPPRVIPLIQSKTCERT